MNLIKTILPNQLVQNGNFESASGWGYVSNYVSVSALNNILTITILQGGQSAPTYQISTNKPTISGHTYYVSADVYISANGKAGVYGYGGSGLYDDEVIGGEWKTISKIFTAYENNNEMYIYACTNAALVGDYARIRNVMFVDLTEEGSGITTVSGFKAKYPLPYYPYRTTTVNALVTANNAPVTADISSMLPSGIGVVDLGSLNWDWDDWYVRWKVLAPSDMQLPVDGTYPLQGLSVEFPIDIFNRLFGTTTLGLCGHPNGYLYMYGLTPATRPTGMLFYKKA